MPWGRDALLRYGGGVAVTVTALPTTSICPEPLSPLGAVVVGAPGLAATTGKMTPTEQPWELRHWLRSVKRRPAVGLRTSRLQELATGAQLTEAPEASVVWYMASPQR